MMTKNAMVKVKAALCAGLAAGLIAGCASMKEDKAAEAKISKADAEKIAMAQVPNGTIKEAELEKENGKLQWSFDMRTPGSRETTEVNIDAITGGVISVGQDND